ncbi:hypothetical protein [Polaribacter sp. IC073]|uniref:hypothetical protein n=1 Tax=Polaribacter sp. IC073 TaxID=2508540 RepID=UPI0011BF5C21|nr:hypothetical protein [Polaribacter sp. IC073]TXD46512.1 hypothetical protein ES045_13285 [Polaribacter sp. IC073]
MKKLLQLFFFFSFLISFSQSNTTFNYGKFTEPDAKNELSLYFKSEVPKKLLRRSVFAPKKNDIILSFSINKENKPYNIAINTFRSKDLYEAIVKAFEKYPLEKLKLDTLNSSNRYSLQIISKKKNKAIFNCSTTIMVASPPIYDSCSDLTYYEDLKTCLNIAVKEHFYKKANFNLLNNASRVNLNEEKDFELQLYKEVELFIHFSVSKSGQLISNKTRVPTVFKEEVLRILASFPTVKIPGTFNGLKNEPLHSFKIQFKQGEKPIYSAQDASSIRFTKPSTENELSSFYLEKLSKEFIEKANLNRINNRLSLSFELDKKNNPFNITTNARSTALNDEVISIFKEYPIEKLTFADKGAFNNYNIQILSFTDGKTIVNTDSIIGYVKFPVFKGCENTKNIAANKKCFSKGIQTHFSEKFNSNLPNQLGLSPGRLRILIRFKIDVNGSVVRVNTKLSKPSPEIDFEVKRVMSLLPKMKSSQMQNGKIVNVKFSFPFTFIVQ